MLYANSRSLHKTTYVRLMVFNKQEEKIDIDLSTQPSGTYFVKVNSAYFKLLKE